MNNGFVYVIGGIGNLSHTSTVRYASINSTGSLGAWSTTTAYPNTISSNSAVVNNGFVYVIGGYFDDALAQTSTVRYAIIDPSGTLGAWATTIAYPHAIKENPVVIYNGVVYSIGGNDDIAGGTSTVRYAQLPSKNTYWGWSAPAGSAAGTYSGQNTFVAVYSP